MKASARRPLADLQVLVVEDIFEVREIMRWMLEAKGATVFEASTGREALDLARTHAFDVVLTDLGLPDIPGYAVIVGIRSASQGRTPVAVISGDQPKALALAIELGAERVFVKPVDWQSLLRYLSSKREAAVVRSGAAARPENGMTVLVIEDDADMRALVCDALEVAGHCAVGHPDGRDIPFLAERGRFDAVILDKELPGPNGLDLLSILGKRLPAVPVIFVTAFGGPSVAAEAASRGAYLYLEKPFRIATILSTLATVSARHPSRDVGSRS